MSIFPTPCGRWPRAGSRGCLAKADRWSPPDLLRSSSPTRLPLSRPTSPLGRRGVVTLDPVARSALLDGSRYRLDETLDYGPDTMRLWRRVDELGAAVRS